jgi:hypothetical protein
LTVFCACVFLSPENARLLTVSCFFDALAWQITDGACARRRAVHETGAH